MSRTLAAVLSGLLLFASPAVLAYETKNGFDYIFYTETDANTAPIWLCGYEGNAGYDGGVTDGQRAGRFGNMGLDACLAMSLTKVEELSASWVATLIGVGNPGATCTAPSMHRGCTLGTIKVVQWDPLVPTKLVYTNEYDCWAGYTSACSVGISRLTYQQAGVGVGYYGDHLVPTLGSSRPHIYIVVGDVPTCPIKPLPPVDGDACTQALENASSTEAQKEAACGTLTPAMQTAVDCFAGKLAKTTNRLNGSPIPLVRTSNRRNNGYQKHFYEIWTKMIEVADWQIKNPANASLCNALRATVAGEKGCSHIGGCGKNECAQQKALGKRAHCLVNPPTKPKPSGDSHTNGTAIDTDRGQTVDPLEFALAARRPVPTIQSFLDEPPACGLRWLGPPPNNDPVHFQVPRFPVPR